MMRTCSQCGVERETRSVRKVYVCTSVTCRSKARVTGQRPHRGARIKLYYKRMQRVRIRKKKKGLPLEIYGF